MLQARVLLIASAAIYFSLGIASVIAPESIAGIVGIELPTAAARVDFRATYGGFEIGAGAFLVLCLWRASWIRAGLWALSLALFGFGTVRAGSLMSEGLANPLLIGTAVAELTGACWSAMLLQRPTLPSGL